MGALGNSLSPAAHAPCEASLVPVDAFPATASESLSSAQMASCAQLEGVKNPEQATAVCSKVGTTSNPPNARAIEYPRIKFTTSVAKIGTIPAVIDRGKDGHDPMSQEWLSLGKRGKSEAWPASEMETDGEGGVECNFGKGQDR